MSVHVSTRWYHAPELILIETDYSSAIVIWSEGCNSIELMMITKENTTTFLDMASLIPGKFYLVYLHQNK